MKNTFKFIMVAAFMVTSSSAWAACAFQNDVQLKSLSAGFEAWKAVTSAMAECGNLEAELDQDFSEKQAAAFAADPSLYQIGGVSNSTFVPLYNQGIIRPLNALIAKYGENLSPNQLIKIGDDFWAIAMMVNAQHLMYREDILNDLGIAVPVTYDDVLAAAQKIAEADVVQYPMGATWKPGFNIALDFVNLYLGEGGNLFNDDNTPAISGAAGLQALETMGKLKEYMDPEVLQSDSTYVQKQFQQGKIAMANLWASRAAAMDNADESNVVGLVQFASAAMGSVRPASTLWWDGIVLAANMTDEQADAAFRVALEGLDSEMVAANNEAAIWLIEGYAPGKAASGAAATAANGAVPYPASSQMGILLGALGNGLAAFITGDKDAATTLADIENEYLTKAKEENLI